MEKSPGVELGRVWDEIPGKMRVDIVRQLPPYKHVCSKPISLTTDRCTMPEIFPVSRETKSMILLVLVRLLAVHGLTIKGGNSMFIVAHVRSPMKRVKFLRRNNSKSIVGKSAEEAIVAITMRETACLDNFTEFPRDRQQGICNGPGGYHPTTESKRSTLQHFLRVLPQFFGITTYTSTISLSIRIILRKLQASSTGKVSILAPHF
jgi:hypothetical protein